MADQLNGLFDSNMPVISPSLTDRILGENGSQTGAMTLQTVKNLVRGTVSKTRAEMLSLISSSGLVVGERYYVSDKGLVADAVATNAISSHVILLSDPSSIYYYNITNDVLGTGIKLSGWGEPKGGYLFDGTNDYVSIPYTQKTKGINFWIYPTTTNKAILNFGTDLQITFNSSNVLTYGTGITNSTTYVNGKQTTQLTLNIWQFVAIVFDEITPTVLEIGRYSTSYFTGKLILTRTFNRALSQAEVISLYNNGLTGQNALPIADIGANSVDKKQIGLLQTGWSNPSGFNLIYSGGGGVYASASICPALNIIPMKKYRIDINISSITGSFHIAQYYNSTWTRLFEFISTTGIKSYEIIIPYPSSLFFITVADANAINFEILSITQIGCVAEYLPENAGDYSWYDSSGNRLHGEVVSSAGAGGASPLFRQLIQKATTGNFTTNIASGVASKVIYCPPGYSINSIAVRNTLASGNITDFQAVMAGVNLVTGKTINNAKSVIFKSIADHEISTSPQAITFTATGNGTGGIEISVAFFRRD